MSLAIRKFSSASVPKGPSEPGTHGTPDAFMTLMAETLSPINRMVSARGPDEYEAALLDALGEVGVLRQKPVAGMNCDRVGHLGGADDGRHVEVRQGGLRRSYADGLVGQQHVLGVEIGG